jgi:hypothetical protein
MMRVSLFHELQILAINPSCTIFVLAPQDASSALKDHVEKPHVLSMFSTLPRNDDHRLRLRRFAVTASWVRPLKHGPKLAEMLRAPAQF